LNAQHATEDILEVRNVRKKNISYNDRSISLFMNKHNSEHTQVLTGLSNKHPSSGRFWCMMDHDYG
jgi:hypothetical protein